jgi:folylpolyglutamate synthase/dihydropteroate synthase
LRLQRVQRVRNPLHLFPGLALVKVAGTHGNGSTCGF